MVTFNGKTKDELLVILYGMGDEHVKNSARVALDLLKHGVDDRAKRHRETYTH